MTILGSINTYEENEELQETKYATGIYRKDDENDLSIPKCALVSAAMHPIVAGMIWLAVFILTLLGITLPIFEKPQQKPKDIEFVLVNKEADPINRNTKYRADRNSRAGGKHDPNRPVSQPQAVSKPSKPQKSAPTQHQKTKQQAQKQQTKQPARQQQQQRVQPKAQQSTQTPLAPKSIAPKPTPQGVPKTQTQAPKPTLTPSIPKTTKPNGSFNIPVPKIDAPKVAGPTGGPITGSRVGSGSPTGSTGSGSRTPAPSFSPSGSGSSTGGRFSPSSAGVGGNIGNPGPGNPKGAPGIDALKEADWGPYMRELQRRIKMNWEPPKGNESKRVVLLFKIARDGRLISHRIYKSSGLAAADRAAMSAVELTAPFKPLPPEYKEDSVEIQFTFDYNVFGATAY